MSNKEISRKIKLILDGYDIEDKDIILRKKSKDYTSEIELLLDHLSIVVKYLIFDNEASRRELFHMKALLEESNHRDLL